MFAESNFFCVFVASQQNHPEATLSSRPRQRAQNFSEDIVVNDSQWNRLERILAELSRYTKLVLNKKNRIAQLEGELRGLRPSHPVRS